MNFDTAKAYQELDRISKAQDLIDIHTLFDKAVAQKVEAGRREAISKASDKELIDQLRARGRIKTFQAEQSVSMETIANAVSRGHRDAIEHDVYRGLGVELMDHLRREEAARFCWNIHHGAFCARARTYNLKLDVLV